jgi:hypothetical protein
MAKGISVFTGMGYSLNDNLEYIEKAGKMGFTGVFTSLHIPEADYAKSIEEFKEITNLAREKNMKVVADISPRAFKYLGADMNNLKVIKDLKVHGVRVDFGFTPEEIAEFTRNPYGLKIEINASTVTKRFLDELDNYRPDYGSLQACHNYYPRNNTGLSIKTFLYKNQLLKENNIEISSFIPSQTNKRGPIFEGLPVLEMHRCMRPEICAKHLFALGCDNVIFGDCIPSDEELKAVGHIIEDAVELRVNTFNPARIEENIMFSGIHANRPDCAEDVVRSTASRGSLGKGGVIDPHNNIARKMGYVTIDNAKYLRYCGELQICKKDLPSDERVNVTAEVIDEEKFLIDYIDEETRFILVKVNTREGQ